MKVVQEKCFYHGWEGKIEKSVPRITVWHHEASLVMPDSDARDGLFYPPLTSMILLVLIVALPEQLRYYFDATDDEVIDSKI